MSRFRKPMIFLRPDSAPGCVSVTMSACVCACVCVSVCVVCRAHFIIFVAVLILVYTVGLL